MGLDCVKLYLPGHQSITPILGEPVKLTNNALSGVLRAFYESDEVITLFFCVTHKLKLIKIP